MTDTTASSEQTLATAGSVMTRREALDILTASGQPYELAERVLFGQKVRSFANAPKNLAELYADARSDETFLVYEDERLTFDETWQRASRLASALIATYGLKHGDRVAISMRNYPEWVISFMAATSIGCVAVAMNSLWQPDEMAYGLTDSGSRVLIADQERLQRFAQYEAESGQQLDVVLIGVRLDQPILSVLTERVVHFEELLDAAGPAGEVDMPLVEVAQQDNATILYTSGSTGHPKGVLSCHLNILSALMSWELDQQSMALCAGITGAELPYQNATLLAVPLFHATGSHAVFLASFRTQRKLVSMHKWHPGRAARLIEREQISSFIAPAAMTGDLVAEAAAQGLDLSTLVTVGGGGAPRAPEQVKRIQTTFRQALPATGWGMTETNAIGTGIGGEDYLLRPNSSGRASAVVDLKIVGDNGQTLAAHERGELLIRGASVIQGYWNRPDANADTFIDGWLRTGDVAYLDEDGFLFIVDRIKDLVIRGGENIGCGEVESALLEHPLIHEASVYGVPDERLGEEVGATCFADDALDETGLREFLETRLARFKVPRYLIFVNDPLPRTASGKILKRELKESAEVRWSGRPAAGNEAHKEPSNA